MTVKVLRKGLEIIGLHFGKGKLRSYFPTRVPTVDLELDHLRIQCELRPAFWADTPDIKDPRLNVWLAAKFPNRKPGKEGCRVLMSRTNESSFRLQVAPPKLRRRIASPA